MLSSSINSILQELQESSEEFAEKLAVLENERDNYKSSLESAEQQAAMKIAEYEERERLLDTREHDLSRQRSELTLDKEVRKPSVYVQQLVSNSCLCFSHRLFS